MIQIPFPEHKNVLSIGIGVGEHIKINCHNAREVGIIPVIELTCQKFNNFKL